MDKCFKKNTKMDILILKTGINYYRCFSIILSILIFLCSIFYIIFNSNLKIFIILCVTSLILITLTIFMEKVVIFLHLPGNYLIVTNDEIIYKTKEKKVIFKIENCSLKFHSFFEDFESISSLYIFSAE